MRKTWIAIAALWLGLTFWLWFGPRTEISEAERRKLEQFPTPAVQTLLDGRFMNKFETFTQDQFPLRENFRRMKAWFSQYLLRRGDSHGIYLAEGSAAKLEYPLNEASLRDALAKFQRICEMYLDGSEKVVFSVVPDKSYYLAQRNGYPAMDYETLFAAASDVEWAEYVDLTDCLEADSYYTTDIHWRQETLLSVAEKLAAALGAEIEDYYLPRALERPFYGVYYGQAALPLAPETIYLLESDTLSACTVTNTENDRVSAVYDTAKLQSRDLYDVFLSGPVSVLTIENPNAETNRELLLFRDSFASSLAPLLVPAYAKITLVDIRYTPIHQLSRYVDFHGQDVLFLYSTTVLNNSMMLKE